MLSVVYKIGDSGRVGSLSHSVSRVGSQGFNCEVVVAAGDGELLGAVSNIVGIDEAFVVDSPSLTVARNEGARRSSGEAIAFMDDDAYPEDGWAERIVAGLDENDMAGGPLVPDSDDVAGWLPEPFHWLIGCGPYYDEAKIVPNTYGSNLAITREAFEDVGGFDESIGMGSGGVGQGAETDLCRRVRDGGYSGVWYDPKATVRHEVGDRASLAAAHARAFEQGKAKAEIGVGGRESTFIRDELLGVPGSATEAAATWSLTAAVGTGYLTGKLA